MKTILNRLINQQTLNREEARNLLINVTTSDYNSEQIASFLAIVQLRRATLEELKGFRDAMLELCIPLKFDNEKLIDLCGTGGDGKNTINISTLASFVVAGTGERVAKHGNYGISSGCGSSNILEYFGYQFSSNEEALRKELDKAGICFLHAPIFHPAMKKIAPIRKRLAIKTFFNILGPMINPASPSNQLIGVYSPELVRTYGYIYKETGKNFAIVHSYDGYDEISLTGEYKILTGEKEQILHPEDLGLERLKGDEIKGGNSIKESAELFLKILKGEGTRAQNSVIAANAATAIQCIYPNKPFSTCFELAEKSLLGGKALQCFKNLIC